MKQSPLIPLGLFLGLSACHGPAQQALDHGWAPPGACLFVGNRADRHFCATTGTQILANPSVYDGQLVRLSGWAYATPDASSVVLFLTHDAYELGQSHAAINLSGPSAKDIAHYALNSGSFLNPVQIRIEGRFHLYGLTPDGDRAPQGGNRTFDFGAIDEVEWLP